MQSSAVLGNAVQCCSVVSKVLQDCSVLSNAVKQKAIQYGGETATKLTLLKSCEVMTRLILSRAVLRKVVLISVV